MDFRKARNRVCHDLMVNQVFDIEEKPPQEIIGNFDFDDLNVMKNMPPLQSKKEKEKVNTSFV